MEAPEPTQRAGVKRYPVGARFVLWLVVSLVGVVVILQLMFLVGEAARPVIGTIADDSIKERMFVAGFYAVWFGFSALVSVLAWRRLLSR